MMQVTCKLKLGRMWDINGTYIGGMGVQYREHTVLVAIDEKGSLTGKALNTTQGHM